MILPEKVKIGAHTYTLEQMHEWRDMGEDTLGETDYLAETIRIRTGLSDTSTFSTLIHEAMHVMNQTLDHELLDSLSEQMAQFLLDNGFIKRD